MKNNGKALYGNCDEFLYLGGNEQSTHKYVAELLGKETIDTNTYGKSSGHSGNYSTNYQQTGRELLTADEVRMLDNSKSILLIRGEKPVIDNKYDILKHPNVKFTTDGKGKNYEYGLVENATGHIEIFDLQDKQNAKLFEKTKDIKDYKDLDNSKYEILTDEDLEEYFLIEDYENNQKKEKSKVEN